jgi:luciferase family oxidoreductase group 1
MSRHVPLGVLDLVPVPSGASPGEALRNTIDLAQRVEEAGYVRYWFAEHHLNPGVAGSSPAVLIALVAGMTERIRLGSGGVQSGHRTALSVVEEFGLIDSLYPGRLDLGLGRSGGRDFFRNSLKGVSEDRPSSIPRADPGRRHTANGLLIPERPSLGHLVHSPRVSLTADLLQQAGARSADYGELLHDIVGLLHGSYRSADGLDPRPVPGQAAAVELWVLGSSAGQSAAVAGELGLRFAANYHVSPATVLEAVDAYRHAFVPTAELDRPYVAVSADVVVAADDATARELAKGYGLWVRSIRKGLGAIEFPTPQQVANHEWSEDDRRLVADRVDTQFVGSPTTVVDQLQRLRDATDADELVITTITHDHADRVRSYQLLSDEWQRDAGSSLGHSERRGPADRERAARAG